MAKTAAPRADDWAGSLRPYLVAWGIPLLVLIAAAFVEPIPRTLAWSGVLVWADHRILFLMESGATVAPPTETGQPFAPGRAGGSA